MEKKDRIKDRKRNFIHRPGSGFTMVELIVVLVILAILAAVVVPLMLGFSDSAKEKKYTEEAKRALTAAETMLSNAYTENLTYVPARLREQAEKDANLPDTALTVYTKKTFRDADGTSKTLACYTIAEAVYKTGDGHYLYYDGSEWTVMDSQPSSDKITYSDNNIIVWPRGQYLTDSAGNASETTVQVGDETTEVITEDDDNKTHDYSADNPEEPEPDSHEGVFRSAYIELVCDDNSVSFGGESTFKTIYSENNGFAANPSYTLDTMLYDDAKMTWKKEGETPYTSASSFSSRVKALVEQLAPPEDEGLPTTTFTFHVSAEEKTISIPITFEAYNKKTLSVSVIGGDDNTNTATVKYGMVSGLDISQLPDVSVSGNDNTKFSGTWYGKSNGVDISGAEVENTNFAANVKSAVDSWIDAKVQEAENTTGTLDVYAIEAQGISFVAPADVYKILYVKETDGAGYTGLIRFGSGAGATAQLTQLYARNEKTGNLYEASSVGTKTGDPLDKDTYSVFENDPIMVGNTPIASARKKLKFWHIFESDMAGNAAAEEDANMRNRLRDCSKKMLDKLYASNYTGYGEVAEIELADLTTKLNSNKAVNNETPLKNQFVNLAGSAANIKSINFVNDPDNLPSYGNSDKEICISTTTIKAGTNGKLARDTDGSFKIDVEDPDYPGYTVAYRVSAGSGKYDIYVFTEDGSDMKAVGSYRNLHSQFSAMTTNTFVSHLDTEDVNDMSYMFSECTELTGVTFDNFTFPKVESTSYMFNKCGKLTSITLSGPAPKLTTMSYMFSQCKAMTSLDLGDFDTSGTGGAASKLVNTQRMLDGADHLTSLDIRGLDTRSVTNMESMFRSCDVLQSIEWDDGIYPLHIDSATDINSLFYKCHAIQGVRLVGSNADSKATTAIETPVTNPYIMKNDGIFKECNALQTVKIENIKFSALTGFGNFFSEIKPGLTTVVFDNVVAPSVTSFAGLFGNDKVDSAFTNLTTVNFKRCGFAGVTTMEKMFRNCTSLQVSGIDFTDTDFGSLNNTKYMFAGCTGFVGAIDLDSTHLDLSNVTNMQYMFEGCTELTSVTVFPSCSSGVNCDYMFHNCDALNVVDSFNIQYASSIKGLFQSCDQLTSVTLTGSNSDSGDASAIDTSLTQVADVFKEDGNLKTINIKNLRFSELKGMGAFFTDVKSSLTTVSITNVVAPQITSFAGLFGNDKVDSAFTNLTTVNFKRCGFAGVTTMEKMFRNCTSLQVSGIDFTDTDFGSLNNTKYMFAGCTGFVGAIDLDSTHLDLSNVTNMQYMFEGCTELTSVTVFPSCSSGVNCDYMFHNCDALNVVDSFNIQYASSIKGLFQSCDQLTSVTLTGSNSDSGDASAIDTSLTQVADVFKEDGNLKTINIKNLRFSELKGMGAFFTDVKSSLTTVSITNVAAPQMTSFSKLFQGCSLLNSLAFDWKGLSTISDMSYMFSGCSSLDFEQVVDIVPSNTAGVNCKYMFENCDSFTDVESFNIRYVSDISNLFDGCDGLVNVSLVGDGMDQGALLATDENKAAGVFNSCPTFSTLTISNLYFEKYQTDGELPGNAGTKDGNFSLQRILKWVPAETVVLKNIAFPVTFGAMSNMFNNNDHVKSVVFENLKLPGLGRMKQMFYSCESLENVTFKDFDAPYAWNYGIMFKGCSSLQKIVFDKINEPGGIYTYNSVHASDYEDMLNGCIALHTIKGIEKFNTTGAVAFTRMFYDCRSLVELDLSGFDTNSSNDGKMNDMFGTTGESQLTTIYATEKFVVRNTNNSMFGTGLIHLTGGEGTTIATAAIAGNKYKEYYGWIDGRARATGTDTQGYLTSSIYKAARLKQTNANWSSTGSNVLKNSDNYKKVTSFQRYTTSEFMSEKQFEAGLWSTIPDANKFECHDETYNEAKVYFWLDGTILKWWSQAKIVYINGSTSNMFQGWVKISSIDFTGLDTSEMTNMSFMFDECRALSSIDLSGFNTANVTTMQRMFGSAQGHNPANYLTELDLSSFDTTNLTSIQDMFIRCSMLKTIYVDPMQWVDRVNKFPSYYANIEGGNTFKDCSVLEGKYGTKVKEHGIKASAVYPNEVYPDVVYDPNNGDKKDNDMWMRAYYAICDEGVGEDLNGNGLTNEHGYFTDIASKP